MPVVYRPGFTSIRLKRALQMKSERCYCLNRAVYHTKVIVIPDFDPESMQKYSYLPASLQKRDPGSEAGMTGEKRSRVRPGIPLIVLCYH
jgi:hypothetical protein